MENDHFREYEITLLVSPTLSDSQAGEFVAEFIEQKIKKDGGDVTFEDNWGRRRLAYPIKKQDFAYYSVIDFLADPQYIATLDEDIRLNPSILRHLIIAVDKYAKKSTLSDIEFWNSTNLPKDDKQAKQEKKMAPRPRKSAYSESAKKPAEQQPKAEPVDKAKLDQKLDAILGDSELNI